MQVRTINAFCLYKSTLGLTMGLYLFTYFISLESLIPTTGVAIPFMGSIVDRGQLVLFGIAWLCVCIAVLEVLCGLVADRFGRKKAIILGLVARGAFFVAITAGCYVSNAHSGGRAGVLLFFVGLTALACFVALDSGTASAWLRQVLIDIGWESDFTRVSALGKAWSWLTFFVGSLASCLVLLYQPSWTPALYALAAVLVFLSTVVLSRIMPMGGACHKTPLQLLKTALGEFIGNPLLWMLSVYYASAYLVFYLVDGWWVQAMLLRPTSSLGSAPTLGFRGLAMLAVFCLLSAIVCHIIERKLSDERWAPLGRDPLSLAWALAFTSAIFAVPLLLLWAIGIEALDLPYFVSPLLVLLLLHKMGDGPLEPIYDGLQNVLIVNDDARATTISTISMFKSALVACLAIALARSGASVSQSSTVSVSDRVVSYWGIGATCVLIAAGVLVLCVRARLLQKTRSMRSASPQGGAN